jgi:acetyl-CoA C-acetyltransferase
MSNSIERVGIISSAQTQLRPAWAGLQHVDLISQAVNDVLLGSGLTMRDVGVVIDCGSDVLDGRSISNCGFLGAMGAHHKEESRVEEDGLFGAMYAVNKIAGGAASVALVVAYSKPSESIVENYYSTIAEPFYQRPVGLNKATASGLLASQYLSVTDASEEDFAKIAAWSWARGAKNSQVADAKAYTFDDVNSSPLVASPLHALAMSRPVDGAVAMLLAVESVARKLSDAPVWITGMGSSMDSQFLSERAPGELEACKTAANGALRRSGRKDVKSFDLAEISATSSAEEAMVVEALGLAERGKAVGAYGGSVDINPSGGALPADPIMATGLVRLHEAATRLSGRVADSTATSALVHASGGIGMQTHSVFTLEV